MTEKKQNDNVERMKIYVRYSGLGFQVVAIILLAVWAGMKCDEWLENEFPALTLIFTVLSVFLSMYYLYKRVNSGK